MKTFFSILSIPIRPESGEQIALGLIMSDGESSIFQYSSNKLNILNHLISKEQIKFIRKYLRAINNIINKVDINDYEIIPFPLDQKNLVINEPYIDYLSIYNKNVLTFSKPVKIDLPVIQETYNKLFEKFIDQQPDIFYRDQITSNVTRVREDFIPSIKQYFTTDCEISEKQFPGIIIPVTVDLYGKNEHPVFAQFVDLERKINYIKNDYYDLKVLKEAISTCHSFLITAEPIKDKFPVQHDIWNHIRASRIHENIDISEVERIREYAIEHNVTPC